MSQSGPSWTFKAMKNGKVFMGSTIANNPDEVREWLKKDLQCESVIEVCDYYQKSRELRDKIQRQIQEMNNGLGWGDHRRIEGAATEILRLLKDGE